MKGNEGVKMNQKRVITKYSNEFREEAVALVTQQGYTVKEAASSLGITTKLIYKWKDNKKLLMRQEILKKASIFFAKETR